jgi:hypothetical protein
MTPPTTPPTIGPTDVLELDDTVTGVEEEEEDEGTVSLTWVAFASELVVDDSVVGEAPEVWPTATAEEAPDVFMVVLDIEPLLVALVLVTELWVVAAVVGSGAGGGVSVLK